ncbi:MAG: histidinol-phosphate transaminase [Chloroflexota bacterium]
MFDPQKMIRPTVAQMKPYTPILPFEVLSKKLGREPHEIIKLDANENPYGPSPKAVEGMHSGQFFHIYPDPESTQLRELISDYASIPIENICAGMGADELIDLVLRVILSPGDGVIDCPPTFGMYPFSTAVNDGQYIPVPRLDDFSLDIEGIETAVANHPNAKALFVCSPNNPNGSVVSDETLKRLLELPILIILDEAYIDFAEINGHTSHISWVPNYQNLVVFRTFSKLAGLAGLRVGFGGFPDWLMPHLWKIKQPYNINVAANLAAIGALGDAEWLQEKTSLIVAERQRLFAALQEIPFLTPYPSESNFILCRVEEGTAVTSAKQLKLDLEKAGILVRYFSKPRLENCIRISVGKPKQTDALLNKLREFTG